MTYRVAEHVKTHNNSMITDMCIKYMLLLNFRAYFEDKIIQLIKITFQSKENAFWLPKLYEKRIELCSAVP